MRVVDQDTFSIRLARHPFKQPINTLPVHNGVFESDPWPVGRPKGALAAGLGDYFLRQGGRIRTAQAKRRRELHPGISRLQCIEQRAKFFAVDTLFSLGMAKMVDYRAGAACVVGMQNGGGMFAFQRFFALAKSAL